ncbi:hypothetical protein PHAVU_006G130500 [Phaseolus vulgaris]|uniref:Pectinesterase inhibitor domain-containing protein n=1 Tax=Phaseolus vulgaris TaxID=3885 RepID=V7BSF5_PHAVU|nr:hypothetical protein PHAVU_006G130500g [Phaseolus vulgaris]ESW19501.1 hypothetical protein PHAVU_006G130500g [Phaseolus vulgaris]
MAFTLINTLCLFVSFSGLLFHTHAIRTPQARVWALCKPTTNPVVCFKTILPHVITAKKFNAYTALEIEIIITRELVVNTTNLITTLLANPSNSKSLNDSLEICSDQYDNMLDSIKDAMSQVALRNAGEARFKFSAVLSYLSACTDEFDNSPIVKEGKELYDIGGNCLDIMKAIEDRESRLRRRGATVGSPPAVPSPCQNEIGPCS